MAKNEENNEEGIVESNIDKISDEDRDFYSDDNLYNINSWGADLSFRELITMYDEGELLKPEIQRYYVWDKVEASRFIESLLMGLPVPSIFLAKKENRKLIVDGYQRIMTVHDFIKGIFSTDNSVFKLSDIEGINEKWRGKTFEQLSADEQRRIKSTTIHAIIFEQTKPEGTDTSLYQIFERINTGGRTLTPQEIRNCVYQGSFNKLLIKLNKNNYWRKLYRQENIDLRMRDIEFILRFFTLSDRNVLEKGVAQISLKKELNLYMGSKDSTNEKMLMKREKDFEKVMKFIYENFGDEAFRNFVKNKDGTFKDFKTLSEKFNPTIFDSIAIATLYALKRNPEINIANLKQRRISLLRNKEFIDYTSVRTTNIKNIIGRIDLALQHLYGMKDD